MQPLMNVAAGSVAIGLTASIASGQVTIPTTTIGHIDNGRDPFTGDLYGAVAYTYNIGTTEVTNAQYAVFLNAVAATDSNGLYNSNMAGPYGGITRSGSPGAYTYGTVSGRDSNPVNFVSFWDAARFANWLHNGQPVGPQNESTTEDGAYTLTPEGVSANTITRNAGWQWAVTSEDEWYKAAYHQPASEGGDTDDYWLYPTSGNIITTAQANYDNLMGGNTTPVGSYAANYYGTYDMGGNVMEWNEAIILSGTASLRGIRGGTFVDSEIGLRSDDRGDGVFSVPGAEGFLAGFRVSQIPTPSSASLLAFAGIAALRRTRGPGK